MNFITDFIKNKPLRFLIITVFTVPILFFSTLTGYLAYVSNVHTLKESAKQISALVNDDITKMLMDYLDEPYRLEQLHKNTILNQQIDFTNQQQRDKYFVETLKLFPRVTNTYVSLATGYEYGARREDNGSYLVWSSDIEKKSLDYYTYNDQFGRQAYLRSISAYDTRQRPPYLKGLELEKPGWTDVFYSATGRGLVVTAVYPVYTKDNQLVGILGSSLLLNWIDEFLKSLAITEHSSLFIISKNGDIIASTDDTVTKIKQVEKTAALVNASENPLLSQAIKALKEKVPVLDAMNSDVDLIFDFNDERFVLHAYPINEKNSLQWMSIIVIPEKDLTYHIRDFIKQLIFITLIACILGLITGVLAARYILNPIIRVNQMSRKIAEGNFPSKIEMNRQDEIGQLIHTVNDMSIKLKTQLEAEKEAAETEKRMREQGAAMNKAVGSFVPYPFLYMLGKYDIAEINPGDHVEKEITILFSDIRSYTKISEGMSNNELFQFVNRYLDLAVDVITINNGFIDKFIGDAIMALFPDGGDDALRAIIELRQKMQQQDIMQDGKPIKVGAGIHFGSVTLGTVGTYTRMDTTVLGDSVNLASRLESATKTYGIDILISESLYCQLQKPEQFHIRELDTVKVKGKSLPIKVYEVFDSDPEELKQLKLATAPLFAQGLALYKKGDFTQAMEIFKQCKDLCPEDQVLPIYIKRCGTLQRIPPGPDWKGISGI